MKKILPVEERTDFIYIDNNVSKFYPHPTIERIYCSTDGQIAQTRLNGKTYLLNQHLKANGYLRVAWTENGKSVNHLSHRLIAQTLLPLPNDTEVFEVNHILQNSRNSNNISNLEFLTKQENLKKRDESGILLKDTYQFDYDTKTVTKYDSRGLAAEANGLQTSNISTAIKYGGVIKNKYFFSDIELTPYEYECIWKEHELKKNTRKRVRVYRKGFERIFETAIEADKFIGCYRGTVSKICNGIGKTAFGWKAEYVRGGKQ